MEQGVINDVSDTALWVAAFRAIESRRKDALFNDALAEKLAGDKGFKIVAATPSGYRKIMKFVMAIRTVAIDRLVQKAVSMGADTVVNLGTGLDTRPYRMDLPATLNWVEVDFPGIINYKTAALQQEKPRCNLQRISCNLSDTAERDRVFAQLSAQSKMAVVITEGVTPYLTNAENEGLSRALYAVPAFRYWIQDYRQGERAVNRHSASMKHMLANAPFKFTELDPLQFFESHGWRQSDIIYMFEEGKRNHRPFPFPFPWNIVLAITGNNNKQMRKSYGYVMFEKG